MKQRASSSQTRERHSTGDGDTAEHAEVPSGKPKSKAAQARTKPTAPAKAREGKTSKASKGVAPTKPTKSRTTKGGASSKPVSTKGGASSKPVSTKVGASSKPAASSATKGSAKAKSGGVVARPRGEAPVKHGKEASHRAKASTGEVVVGSEGRRRRSPSPAQPATVKSRGIQESARVPRTSTASPESNVQRGAVTHATPTDIQLQGTNLRQANLVGADLRGISIWEADLAGACLDEANLSNAVLDESVLVDASLERAVLDKARLRSADLSGAYLRGASLRETDLSRADCEGADFNGACLDDAQLRGTNLKGVDLRDASLLRADLRGARYDRTTRWPEAFDASGRGLVHSSEENLGIALTTLRPGQPYPLGATWDGEGVNFSILAERASHVELCLFDRADAVQATTRIRMPEQTDGIWHIYIPHLAPGQLYGYRVFGPYKPERGLRFNPNKLLIDPYAKALSGPVRWDDSVFGYTIGHALEDLSYDERNSTAFMPKCVVVDTTFPWGDDRPLRTPLHKSIIYELHVKGFTKLHPGIPGNIRGTYVALGSQVVIDYLKSLGVTAVELLPVHEHVDDRFLVDRGLCNYWGYNTLSYFAPNTRYKSDPTPGAEVREFKSMVKALHAAGIEVILDVVYNHTAEGNHLGPTLCYRGLDNSTYYRTVSDQPRYYMDYTGCGNTINALHARSLQLMMDSLRYWVTEMHVDGFRFDLAAALMRGLHEADRLSAFFDVISQDPVISSVKLIAEPWDVGPGGYQVGNFPHLWSEWNGKYRDTVRRFWKGDESQVGELAFRLSGSSDLYQHNGRQPYASINFVTSHDGFTLGDLVSYNDKHNEANQDDNRDGDSHNCSWNCGEEGPTDKDDIVELRARQRRNLMATLLLSQGVPMLLAGDERCRSQAGNNNAYCQDNEISWLDWSLNEERREMLEFTRMLVRLRQRHPSLCRRRFFFGRRVHGAGIRDIGWYQPSGHEMTDQEWSLGYVRCLGMLVNGEAMHEWATDGTIVHDQPLLVLFNAHHEEIAFAIPECGSHTKWEVVFDTTASTTTSGRTLTTKENYPLGGRSLVVLRTGRRTTAATRRRERDERAVGPSR